MTLGPIETRNAAIDALSHALESIWNKNRNDETLRLAIEAARLIVNALPIVLNNLQSLKAREKLSIGSLRAGQAMSVTQTSLAHALSYEDTLSLRLPHGEAVGRWLPVVYHNALSSDKTAARALSEALGSSITSAKEFALWLESMGLRTVNPYQSNPTIQNRMTQALLSTRGQTFSGELHFG
jgi:alcohol dehydrogenase class IV